MKYLLRTTFAICLLTLVNPSFGQTFSREQFLNPPINYWPRPLWFWNNTEVKPEKVVELMQAMRDKCGYGGFGVIPFGKNFKPEYLSEDYFKIYGIMLQKAEDLGMTVSLYDECGFPSGSVGAFDEGDGITRFKNSFPEQTIRQLNKMEEEISGPVQYERTIPGGKLMGIVAMETTSLKRVDLTAQGVDGVLKWKVPEGTWKIMLFNCVNIGIPIVDYLNPEYVRNFTRMVHDTYYGHFKGFFGTVIGGSFFDEPSMFHAKFRMWTDAFNEKFKRKYGFSPVMYYPSMWYDIGSETESARNLMFGFRAQLYAEGFTKEVSDWSLAHGIAATGHTAPEEELVPVNSCGDLMKSFKYLDTPGIDKIGGHRPAERFYKVISSAANNWDKRLVMSETYGAMPDYDKPGDLSWNDIFSIAMDQYCKGINMLIPHAVWYDNTKVTYKPELSHRSPLYADSLQVFTRFLSRLNVMLQKNGRHVADIAIVYPIYSLLSEHTFDGPDGPANTDPLDPTTAYYKKVTAQIDYIDVSNWLTNLVGKDYTFLHPEVLDEKCSVEKGILHLQNKINREDFKIIIVPSCRTISVSNLQKIVDFYNSGGKVIFTTRIPVKSLETGQDKKINVLVNSVFPKGEESEGKILSNNKGGKVCFIAHPNDQNLREALQQMENTFDVDYPVNENIRYIHKVVNNLNMYYFANVGNTKAETRVILRGDLNLESWDPHTGGRQKLPTKRMNNNPKDLPKTQVELSLKPFQSIFYVESKN